MNPRLYKSDALRPDDRFVRDDGYEGVVVRRDHQGVYVHWLRIDDHPIPDDGLVEWGVLGTAVRRYDEPYRGCELRTPSTNIAEPHGHRKSALRYLHRFGYWLWCWTDKRMPESEERRG